MAEFSELYYRDPYCRKFRAAVTECVKRKDHYETVLSDTAFYPEGGGQPGDRGVLVICGEDSDDTDIIPAGDEEGLSDEYGEKTDTLRGKNTIVHVTDTVKRGEVTVHITDAFLPEGTQVFGEIDWETRFSNMQAHTGEHILSGLIHRRFGYDNVGFSIGERIRIDFNGTITWEELMEEELAANRIVWRNEAVAELYPDADELLNIDYRSKKEISGKVRLIEIPEADCCACCGTHVSRTGEVGIIKCLSLMHYKKGVRIELLCGRRALEYLQKIHDENSALAEEFSVKPLEVYSAVQRMREDEISAKQRAAANMNRYIRLKCSELPDSDGIRIFFEEGLSPDDERRFADMIVKTGKAGTAAVLSLKEAAETDGKAEDAPVYSYAIETSPVDGKPAGGLREKAKKLNTELYGRGGGSPQLIQGIFRADKEKIRGKIHEILEE